MRFIRALFVSLLFGLPLFAQGNGAVSVIQASTAGLSTDSGTNPSGTFASAQTAGNVNLVMTEYCGTGSNPCGNNNPGPITSVTDTEGNTYVRVCGPLSNLASGSFTGPCGGGTYTFDYQNTIVEAWVANNIKAAGAGANTFTMHVTSTANMKGWNTWFFELHIATAGSVLSLDKAVTTATLSAPSGGMGTGATPTTSASNEIAIAWCLPVSGLCQPSPTGWTENPLNGGEDFDTHSDVAYKILTSTQAVASAVFGTGSIGTGDEAIAGIFTLESQEPVNTCPSASNYVSSTGASTTLAALGVTACYFISASGADTNDGATESTSWLHSPGMKNCANNCAALSVVAGDGFIFRGGDSWHFGNSGLAPYGGIVSACETNGTIPSAMCLQYTGTSSHPVYFGIDQSWYTGTSWVRPVFTEDNPLTPNPGVALDSVASCAHSMGSAQILFGLANDSYVMVDGLEGTGLCEPAADSGGNDAYFDQSADSNDTLTRVYVHGWTHVSYSSVDASIKAFAGSDTATDVYFQVFVDGSDSDPGGLSWTLYHGGANVSQSVFRYTDQLVTTDGHNFHDNLLEHFFQPSDTNEHPNVYEEAGNGNADTSLYYNNVFRYLGTDTNACNRAMVIFWPVTAPSQTSYVFNNVVYGTNSCSNGNWFNLGQNSNQNNGISGQQNIFNNTLENTANAEMMECTGVSTSSTPLTFANNHYVTDGSSQYKAACGTTIGPVTTVTDAIRQTHAVADANSSPHFDQYTSLETYGYSPLAATNTTVGAGTNEVAFCNTMTGSGEVAIQQAGMACKSDTTFGVSYNASTHWVTGLARTTNTRPASAAWDIGAYEFSGSAVGSSISTGVLLKGAQIK